MSETVPGIRVNFDHDPVCLLTYPETIEVEDVSRMFVDVRRFCGGRRDCALLIDMRAFDAMSVGRKKRQEIARNMSSSLKEHGDFFVCEARIVSSTLVRGFMTVFDWSAPMDWPQRNFGNCRVAEQWICAELTKAGVACPGPIFPTPSSTTDQA